MGETISILAGGWSARGIDLARLPGRVIGVNEAAVAAPNVDIAISMDRLWVEWRWEALQARALHTWIRRGNNRNCEGDWPSLTIFDCDNESTTFTERCAALNGTHSGFCALNLAYRLKPSLICLFGFDHNRGAGGRTYWHDDYAWRPGGATKPGKYAEWARQYDSAAKAFAGAGIEVLNCSLTSAIDAFPKADPRKVLV